MNVLVVNVGGVTLDLAVVDEAGWLVVHRQVSRWDGEDASPIEDLAGSGPDLSAVGHRVVHGGAYGEPVLIDDRVLEELDEATPFAPLHQQRALRGIERAPAAPCQRSSHVACFDTTFHRTVSPAAATYALPKSWRERWPLQRRGFHGLSHAHVAAAAERVAGRPVGRLVSCHLGSGASLCAVRDGASVDTTMGMTPLEGSSASAAPAASIPGWCCGCSARRS